jgi:hypothetical protein
MFASVYTPLMAMGMKFFPKREFKNENKITRLVHVLRISRTSFSFLKLIHIYIYTLAKCVIVEQGRTEGGRVGRNAPLLRKILVFFWSKSRKNEIFLLDLAKKGVAPPLP